MTHHADILIIGAGLVGAAQALALAKYGITSIIIDKSNPETVLHAEYDGRVSAISHASVMILDHIGIWDQLKDYAGPIEHIVVTEGKPQCDVIFHAEEIDEEVFGYMVPNYRLRQALLRAVIDEPNITLISDTTVDTLDQEPQIAARLEHGETVEAACCIVADGRYSTIRERIGIKARKFEYNQSAIVCTVAHSLSHKQTAIEWFFPVGPLAILPMHGGHHSCIVWTEETDMAAHLVSLSDAEFAEELELKLAGLVGDVTLEGKRYHYPLNLFQAEGYHAKRAAIIGDAAHAIHPIAGQGVNLGYRDVAILTELLVNAKRHGQDLGDASVLAHYARWRSFDATSMIAVTDGLNRLFSNHSALVRYIRRTGMGAFERVSPAKQFFMESAMGMSGDLPKMLQGSTL